MKIVLSVLILTFSLPVFSAALSCETAGQSKVRLVVLTNTIDVINATQATMFQRKERIFVTYEELISTHEISGRSKGVLRMLFKNYVKIDWKKEVNCFQHVGTGSNVTLTPSSKEGEFALQVTDFPQVEIDPAKPDCETPRFEPGRPTQYLCKEVQLNLAEKE